MKNFNFNPTHRRPNSLIGAVELSESWHGRPIRKVTEVEESYRVRQTLTDLGALEELVVDLPEPYPNTLRFDRGVRLCAAPPGPDSISRQLYFVGGEQSIDLAAAGIADLHDKVLIGEVVSIAYSARKQHLADEKESWGHHFGDEGGELPTLVYDCLNHRLELVGGSYYIDLTDYDGENSAGIRN